MRSRLCNERPDGAAVAVRGVQQLLAGKVNLVDRAVQGAGEKAPVVGVRVKGPGQAAEVSAVPPGDGLGIAQVGTAVLGLRRLLHVKGPDASSPSQRCVKCQKGQVTVE